MPAATTTELAVLTAAALGSPEVTDPNGALLAASLAANDSHQLASA
ncbi:MAG: hypothetical protein WA942_15305 [Mycolicibacter sinensis]